MEPRVLIDNVPKHLCSTCKFMSKCRRTKTVFQQLLDVEADALEKWKLDVDVTYMIRECDMYSVDWDLVRMMQMMDGIEIEFYEDDEGSEGDDS